MATSGQFIGFNTEGAAKIEAAIDAYVKVLNTKSSFNNEITMVDIVKGYGSGTASGNELNKMLIGNTDISPNEIIEESIKPLRDRIKSLNTQYKNNDDSQANTLNSKAKSILKS